MSKLFQKILRNPKNQVKFVISGISTLTLLASGLVLGTNPNNSNSLTTYNQNGQKVAAAAGETPAYPGQNLEMTINYSNASIGEAGSGTNEMLIQSYIGSQFVIDVNSITDSFDVNGDGIANDTVYKVCAPMATTDRNVTGASSAIVNYRPRSATNANACSGQSTKGAVDFTGSGQQGWFKYKITLNPNILSTAKPFTSPSRNYQLGDLLTAQNNDGIKSTISTWRPNNTTPLGTVDKVNEFIVGTAPINPFTLANLGNGTCWEGTPQNTNPINIGKLTTCAFPLTGGTSGGQSGYSVPSDFNLKLDNASASAPGANCAVKPTSQGATTFFLECTNVPTTNATPGIQPITVTASGQTGPKGTVSLATPINEVTTSSIVCTPNPQVIGSPANCTVNLIGTGPFYIPSDYRIKIGQGDPTACSVTGLVNSNSFTCLGVATAKNNPGTVDVVQSPNAFSPAKGTIALTAPTNPVTNANITSAVCTPTTLYLNGSPATTNCTAQLNANNLTGTVNFALQGMPESCNAPVVLGQNTATCSITPTQVSPANGVPVSASVQGSAGNPVSAGTLNIFSLGRPTATTANPIVGTIGSPMPVINLTNANVPANSPVTFTPSGCSTGILGSITNNVWTAQNNANILDCALINSQNGTLSAPNFPNLNVPTNFSPKPTLGEPIATTASPITGKIGNPFPNIPLRNSNIPNPQTVVTFTPMGCTTPINGTISNQTWMPVANTTIPNCATINPQIGTLKSTGLTDVSVPTNFSPADTLGTVSATPITGIVGITPMPNIPLNGNTLNNVPARFTPSGGTPIDGIIQNNSFIPSNGALIPANATTGPQNGVLSSNGVPSVNVPTNFTKPTLGTPTGTIVGTPGQPFTQNIPLTGTNLPNGTSATFTPPGCVPPNTIAGTIQNGVFVPATGQNLPNCAELGPKNTGTLTSPQAPGESPVVNTNFTPNTTPLDTPNTDVGAAILAMNCIPDPTTVNSTVICSGQLKPAFVKPTANNPLKVKLENAGATEANCTFNSDTTFTCLPANVGTATGVKPALASSGPNGFTRTPETVTVNAKEITTPDLPNIGKKDASDPFLTFECDNNNTAIVSQTGYKCVGTLKPEYVLPASGLKVGVGVAPTGVCLPGSTPTTVNCTNVPVTATVGQIPLRAQVGNETPADTARIITVQAGPTLGTASPIAGQKGTPFPNIPLPTTNLPDGTVANFTPEGGASPIAGQIIPLNGVKTWVPLNNPNIPNNVLTGNKTGTLAVPTRPEVQPLVIPANFTDAPNIGNITGGGLTGNVGGPAGGSIPLSGNLPNNTPATYTNGTNNECVIQGSIQNGAFVPNANQIIDPKCPLGANTTGKITAGGQTAPNAPTNFNAPAETGVLLTPDAQIVFNAPKSDPKVYGDEDLAVTITPAFTSGTAFVPKDCTVAVRPYGTTVAFVNLQTSIVNGKCSAIFPKNLQTVNKWDYQIRLTDPNNQKWGSNISYFLLRGAFGNIGTSVIALP